MKREIVNWCNYHRGPFENCPHCGYAIGYFDRLEALAKKDVKKAEYDRKKYERMMAKKPRPTCLHCSKEIKGRRRKFCDTQCYAQSAKKRVKANPKPKLGWIPKIKHCLKCQAEFLPKEKAQRLCGPQCRWIPKHKLDRKQKNCSECGKPMPYIKRLFCSVACHHLNENRRKRKGKPVHPKCHFCKKPTNHEWKYCGQKCERRAERARKKERTPPKRPLPVLHLKSAVCSTHFDTIHPTKKFCSHKCGLKSDRNKRRIKEKGKKKPIHTMIKNRLSSRLRELLRKKGRQETNAIGKYMGCTPKEMLAHVERQLEGTDMNWSNYGVFGWHLDHIIPCAKFDLTNEEHVAVCFNWRNIRPLWGVDNYGRQDNVSLLDALEIPKELFEMAEKLGIKLWV